MKRLFTMIAIVVLTTLPASTASASTSQDAACEGVITYVEMVDAQVVEEMYAVVSAPGWAEDAQMAVQAMNAANSSLEGVTTEVMQPLLDYLAVPGAVLDGIDPADVPEAALPLHESARDYWMASSGMLSGIVEEGPGAAFPFLEVIETTSLENIDAQEYLAEQCPGLIESYEDDRERLDRLFELLDGKGDAGMLANATPGDLEGMGVFFLFFATEDEPARAATPDIVTVPSPSTVGTPED